MQTSVLKRLLHPIKALKSLAEKRPLAATSEPREEDKMQNAECRMQNDYNPSVTEGDTSLYTREACADKNGDETAEASSVRSYDNTSEEQSEDSAAVTEVSADKSADKNAGLSHLTSSVPRAARVPRGALSKSEMTELRELFGGLSDAEIQRLYKRVTK